MADRPSGPPDPPGPPGPPEPSGPPGRSQKKKRNPPARQPALANQPGTSSQRGIMDFFQPRQRTPSQSSGRGTEASIPASSSDPQLTRGTGGGADFFPGRPRAPTIESLASGIGSLTTLPSSGSNTSLPRSPSLGRGGLSSSVLPPGSPSLGRGSPSTLPPGSPSLGRGSPSPGSRNPPTLPPGSPSLGRGGPSTLPPGSPSLGRGGPSISAAPTKIIYKTFRVVKQFDEGQAEELNNLVGPGFMSLRVGDFGIIPNIPANFVNGKLHPHPMGQLLFQGPVRPVARSDTPWSDGRCRISQSVIELGAFVREEFKLVHEGVFPTPALKLQLSPDSPLQRFLYSFMASLSEAGTQTRLASRGVFEALAKLPSQSNDCRQFVKELLDGMAYCGSLKLFQNGVPELYKIWSELRHVDTEASNAPFTKNGVFFYILMYYNEKNGAFAVYTGKTIKPIARYRQHTKKLHNDDGGAMHYRMARKRLREGATHRLIPIAYLPHSMPNVDLFEAWAETIFIVLFNCFSPIMLSLQQTSFSSELAPDELTQVDVSLENDYYLRACGTPLARMLQTVAGSIKDSDPSLKDFSPKERFTGLNWSVPLTEFNKREESIWIRSTIHGDGSKPAMWEFRTNPRRLTKDRFVCIFDGHPNTRPVRFRPVIPAEVTSLVAGSLVNVVVEILIDSDKRHPYAYARMPTVGPFDCWNEASRLAVRIEFEDEQGWHTQYLKQEKVQLFDARIKESSGLGDEVKHIELGWVHSMKMQAALLNWRWVPPNHALAQRVWVPYKSHLIVIEDDFFNQCLVVADRQSNRQPVDRQLPRLLTLDETAKLIEEKFGDDVKIGIMPNLAEINFEGSAIRTKCDLCLMGDRKGLMLSLPRKCKDRRVVATLNGQALWQCPFSLMMNRYCTFTKGIENRQDLHDLVYHVADGHYPIQPMAPPPNVFQYLEVREKLEEKPVEGN